jgi:flagellar basal-body rod protein FlgB
MDLSKIGIFSLMRQNMDYLGERQDVLSENVANANVPNYAAKDIKRPDFEDFLSSAASPTEGLVTTNSAHIAGMGNAGGGKVIQTKALEITPTGNQVSLEEETMKISKNAMEYQQTTSIYRKMVQLLKMALGEQV